MGIDKNRPNSSSTDKSGNRAEDMRRESSNSSRRDSNSKDSQRPSQGRDERNSSSGRR
ncbi:hypothetical protein [Bdellovibrio sp. GT3]|uniref:hypothetical protein n=1 Tax=unclassified Bdellovibrio TaxID=2633795 RepID=UPI0030F0BA15